MLRLFEFSASENALTNQRRVSEIHNKKQPKQIVEKLYATQKVLSFLYNSFLTLIFYYLYLYFSKEETEAAVGKKLKQLF